MSSGSFKNIMYKLWAYNSYIYCMYKEDLALSNLQELICHKNQQTLFREFYNFGNIFVIDFIFQFNSTHISLKSKVLHLQFLYYLPFQTLKSSGNLDQFLCFFVNFFPTVYIEYLLL